MGYPSFEQYIEALQYPELSLADPALRKGSVALDGKNLPRAFSGGFALTYMITTGGTKYAVRCFHKQSNALEQRYGAISARLKVLRSPYFLDFEFQPAGIRIKGSTYPLVKMAWAQGTTLGEFVGTNRRSAPALLQLRTSLRNLATYLEDEGIAHGDVQPLNLMVGNGGRSVQLIDYDGMFVEALRGLGSSERGQPNFQHPQRSADPWSPRLDRFAFIALDVALRAVETSPDLWDKYQSDADSFLFKANDFVRPSESSVFGDLSRIPSLAVDAKNFATISLGGFDQIPTLVDFLARRNLPQPGLEPIRPAAPATYLSAFRVLDAADYERCLGHVGDRVELVGVIVDVHKAITRGGKPYVFINFGNWKGQNVKVSIWSEGLATLSQQPDSSWQGRWVSAVGLLEPPFRSPSFGYSHLAVSITQASQIHVITQSEAAFRLLGTNTRSAETAGRGDNAAVLDVIKRGAGARPEAPNPKPTTSGQVPAAPGRAPATRNQDILQAMKAGQPQLPQRQVQAASRPPVLPQPKLPARSGCLTTVLGAVVFLALVMAMVP